VNEFGRANLTVDLSQNRVNAQFASRRPSNLSVAFLRHDARCPRAVAATKVRRYLLLAMRSARWCFILFQAIWLGVMMPGHVRGAFTMPGTASALRASAGADEESCCASRVSHESEGRPTQDQKSRCAMCHFAAGLSTPPVVSFAHADLGLVSLLPLPPPQVVSFERFPLPYDATAPPRV
jgi:hypothetical protein